MWSPSQYLGSYRVSEPSPAGTVAKVKIPLAFSSTVCLYPCRFGDRYDVSDCANAPWLGHGSVSNALRDFEQPEKNILLQKVAFKSLS